MKAIERHTRTPRGFTLLELLVVMGILVILTGITVPKVVSLRERERRTICSENLRKIGRAFSAYANVNRDEFPRVIYDEKHMPIGYNAFSGADTPEPFASNTTVAPNDVTASLWLLIRGTYITSEYYPPSAVFICPSSGKEPDPMLDLAGKPASQRQRSNFRSGRHLSYSYASPFGNATGYGLKGNSIAADFVLMADTNPGRSASLVSWNDTPLKLAPGNSPNHHGAGQSVLFGDMHVEFRETPYCGANQDNIYTAMGERFNDVTQPAHPPVKGVVGRQYGPAFQSDSYLLPTAED